MQPTKNDETFLNFLKTYINRNLVIEEEYILNEFTKNQETNIGLDRNRKLFKDIYHLNYLNDFIIDPQINEIIIHDFQNLQIEKIGKLHSHSIHDLDENTFIASLETLALKNKVVWNYSNPFASFYIKFDRLPFRASLIHESCSPLKRSKLFLRRISTVPFSALSFGLNSKEEYIIKDLVTQKKNLIIAGAAGSGKSSLLASFLNSIPETEHVIILEDTHEIPISKKGFTHFLGNESLPNKSLRDLCTFSLRLRPDRMILGEIRSNEIIPFVLAMNTGNKGMMCTIHSDSAIDAVSRMALLFIIHSENQGFSFEMALKLICKNIEVVVFLENKKIKEVIRIISSDKGITNYDYIFRNNLS